MDVIAKIISEGIFKKVNKNSRVREKNKYFSWWEEILREHFQNDYIDQQINVP